MSIGVDFHSGHLYNGFRFLHGHTFLDPSENRVEWSSLQDFQVDAIGIILVWYGLKLFQTSNFITQAGRFFIGFFGHSPRQQLVQLV